MRRAGRRRGTSAYKAVRIPAPLWARVKERRAGDRDMLDYGLSISKCVALLLSEAIDAREERVRE